MLILIGSTREYKYFDYDEIDNQSIVEQIEDLMEFYKDVSIIADYIENEVILQVQNHSMEMWTLEYNIILDATANIDKTYFYNKDIFNVLNQERVYNHKYWKFFWLNVNSTTYGREKVYSNFEEALYIIMKRFLDVENTFIVGKKKDDTETVSKIAKDFGIIFKYTNHYGNMNGSNEQGDLKNFININLNYIEDSAYVIKYLYYSKAKIDNWKTSRGHFSNNKLDEFKTSEVVKSHCQAIKRVNCKMLYRSIIVFLCHREDITSQVYNYIGTAQFVHCLELENLFEKGKTDHVSLFIRLCKEIHQGNIPKEIVEVLQYKKFEKYKKCLETLKIPKCVFAEAIGCKSKDDKRKSNTFGTNVLNKDNVKNMELKTNCERR